MTHYDFYQIQATRNGVQLPTFYLNRNVQGIRDVQSAARVARAIFEDGTDCSDVVHFTVIESSRSEPSGERITSFVIDGRNGLRKVER